MAMMMMMMIMMIGCMVTSVIAIAPCPRPPDKGQCSSMNVLLGQKSEINLSVLRQMCIQGLQHTVNSQLPRATNIPSKRTQQFAVLNLHRDSFSDDVSWFSGGAQNVVCADLKVDETVQLTNGYRWYRHGLPMWPLLNQTIGHKKNQIIKKKLDWPNYAFASPLYLVPHERNNYRDPLIAVQKLFLGDFSNTNTNTKLGFVRPDKFEPEILRIMNELGEDMYRNVEDYKNWLLPLIQQSLEPMTRSFVSRQKNQGSNVSPLSRCPDVLYVFFLHIPCSSADSCPLLNSAQLSVRKAGCTSTTLVVGYRDFTEEINEQISLQVSETFQSFETPSISNSVSNQIFHYKLLLSVLSIISLYIY